MLPLLLGRSTRGRLSPPYIDAASLQQQSSIFLEHSFSCLSHRYQSVNMAAAFSSLPEILQPKEEDIQMMLSAGGRYHDQGLMRLWETEFSCRHLRILSAVLSHV